MGMECLGCQLFKTVILFVVGSFLAKLQTKKTQENLYFEQKS